MHTFWNWSGWCHSFNFPKAGGCTTHWSQSTTGGRGWVVSMYKTQKMGRDDCLVVCFKNSSYVKGTTHTHTHLLMFSSWYWGGRQSGLRPPCATEFSGGKLFAGTCSGVDGDRWSLLICWFVSLRSYTGPWNDRETGQSPVEQLRSCGPKKGLWKRIWGPGKKDGDGLTTKLLRGPPDCPSFFKCFLNKRLNLSQI